MTFLGTLIDLARTDPDALAIVEPGAGATERISRNTLVDRVLVVRRELAEHGFGEGDCLGVWLPNWSAALVWQLAAGSLGGHVIGINTRYGVHEVTHVLTLARPKVIVIAHEFVGLDLIGRLRTAAEDAAHTDGWTPPQVVPIAAPTGTHTGPGAGADTGADAATTGAVGTRTAVDPTSYDIGGGAWLPGAGEPLTLDELAEPSADDLYVAFTTSGSTGLPKLAAHKEAGTLEQCLGAGARTGMGPGKALIAALPFSGTFGFVQAFAMLLSGGVIVMHPSFNPAEVAQQIERYRVTHGAFGDDMWVRIIDEVGDADLSSLEWLGVGDFQGAARGVADWLRSRTTAHVSGLYGSSETFALLTTTPTGVPADVSWLPGGRLVVDALEYRIADGERVITDGSEGELQFRGPQTVDAYLGQPQKMAENHTADGWFRSGDLARAIDERGFRFVCRAAEALRLKGFLVEPDEIGNHIATHPAVEIAKVVGVRRDAGDEAVGFVTLREGERVDGDELVEYCRTSLARYKVPVAVFVIDEMPVTTGTNGTKIRANVLKEWALERLEATS
ncbi:AMP-binding protein [Cumulibacter manganitolerans]|uniref:AMP-binding protein n=1 Tax=Cumulibacter manganitolerans TaxID=1884992 RepID=UPI001295DD5C|nr:AMP-binding protein [Cumulibacter manganitolerans]